MTGEGGRAPRAGGDHEPPGQPGQAPFVTWCEAGKYAYCQCGKSARYPYCDGTHRARHDGPGPIKVVLREACRVAWCACGSSQTRPYCDGSHARLPAPDAGGS